MRLFIGLCMSFYGALVGGLASAEQTAPLRWISEHYAPYNYVDEEGQAKGIAVDVLSALWQRLDIPEAQRAIEFMPWARGYAITQRLPNAVLFSTTYTPARLKLFNFVGPVVENQVVILSRKRDDRVITDHQDLQRLKIGVVRDDIGEQLIIDRGVSRDNIVSSNLAANLVKMLHLERVDVIAYGYDVAVWNMIKAGIDPQQFEISYLLLGGEMGFAFSLTSDPATVAEYQQALDQLKREGVVDEIRARYLRPSAEAESHQ